MNRITLDTMHLLVLVLCFTVIAVALAYGYVRAVRKQRAEVADVLVGIEKDLYAAQAWRALNDPLYKEWGVIPGPQPEDYDPVDVPLLRVPYRNEEKDRRLAGKARIKERRMLQREAKAEAQRGADLARAQRTHQIWAETHGNPFDDLGVVIARGSATFGDLPDKDTAHLEDLSQVMEGPFDFGLLGSMLDREQLSSPFDDTPLRRVDDVDGLVQYYGD